MRLGGLDELFYLDPLPSGGAGGWGPVRVGVARERIERALTFKLSGRAFDGGIVTEATGVREPDRAPPMVIVRAPSHVKLCPGDSLGMSLGSRLRPGLARHLSSSNSLRLGLWHG
eukprot:4906256-Heterocapsa_arctica.AAC.1